jgi:hypothetical protein
MAIAGVPLPFVEQKIRIANRLKQKVTQLGTSLAEHTAKLTGGTKHDPEESS